MTILEHRALNAVIDIARSLKVISDCIQKCVAENKDEVKDNNNNNEKECENDHQ